MEHTTLHGLMPAAREARDLHAGFWRRLLAYIIDGLIIDVGFAILFFAAFAAASNNHPLIELFGIGAWLTSMLFVWLYFVLFESSRLQATPGKLALGLVVTDMHGRRIGFGRATGRFFGKILSGMIFDIGFMMAGWTARKQALHDLVAGTCVVRKTGLEQVEASGQPTETAVPQTPGWVIALAGIGGGVAAIAFIGILAAIAIPLYLNFTIRARAELAVNLLSDFRDMATEAYSQTGAWPTTLDALPQDHYGRLLARYAPALKLLDCHRQDCAIRFTLDPSLDANTHLAGRTVETWTHDGGRHWYCGPGATDPVGARLLPHSCRAPGAP